MSEQKTVYAQDVNYWKTGTTAPDTWIEKAIDEITDVGGFVTGNAFANIGGRQVYSLLFMMGGDEYRVNWPVLPLDPNKRRTAAQIKTDERSARIQAATFLYHDVKAKCMVMKIMGAAAAFMQYRLLPEGSTIAEQGFRGQRVEVPAGLLLGGDR